MEKNSEIMKYSDVISRALKKHRLKQDIICYRNMDINPLTGFKAGDLFTWQQFVSTSVIPGRALKKMYQIAIFSPKGTAGAYIEKVSKFPQQRELLLDKDCVYRVILNQEDKVELEVLP